MIVLKRNFLSAARSRGEPFMAAVIAASIDHGDTIDIDPIAYRVLAAKHPLTPHVVPALAGPLHATLAPPISEPTITDLATNFLAATARWTAAGFPIVPPEIYTQRAAQCDGCEWWNPSARFGLGKCSAPGCGCTRFKRWLATEECPLKLWPRYTPAAALQPTGSAP